MDVLTPITTVYGYFNEKFGSLWASQVESIKNEFGSEIEQVWMPGVDRTDLPTLFVKIGSSIKLLQCLKEKHGYNFLSDITATDEESKPRFFVVYHLMDVETKSRIRIKVPVDENEMPQTAVALWPGANWAEREVFDMFGIRFEGHPDLRRILMDQRWEGHPLRKDYPLRGYQVFLTPEPIDTELLK